MNSTPANKKNKGRLTATQKTKMGLPTSLTPKLTLNGKEIIISSTPANHPRNHDKIQPTRPTATRTSEIPSVMTPKMSFASKKTRKIATVARAIMRAAQAVLTARRLRLSLPTSFRVRFSKKIAMPAAMTRITVTQNTLILTTLGGMFGHSSVCRVPVSPFLKIAQRRSQSGAANRTPDS
jgi:hypothetical protein